jgi:transposase, IS30 family
LGRTEDVVPRYAPNKMPAAVKRRYFEAARQVGVSTSCGSLWFIDAGSVRALEPTPINRRFLSQDDRIEIADGLGRGEPVSR